MTIEVRLVQPGEFSAIDALYAGAFPQENLLPLLAALHLEPSGIVELVASEDSHIKAHMALTQCSIEGARAKVALLGPLAVSSDCQRQGIGSAIVRHGLRELRKQRVAAVYVLGDPVYYRRFGFRQVRTVRPPYKIPDEWMGAWQGLVLEPDAPTLSGQLAVPPPWQQRTLWAP